MMSRCTKKTRRRQQQHWKRQHLIFNIRNGDKRTKNFQLGENNPPNASDGHSSNSNSCPRWNIIDTISVGVTNRTNNAAHTRSSTDRNSHRKVCFLSRIRHFPTGERNQVLITPAAIKYCVMLILFIGCVATCPSEALKSTSFATSLTIQPSYRNNILSKVGFVPSIPNFFSHETNNRRGIKTQQTLLFLTSESANDSQSFHYALEVEDAKGRSKRSVHKLEMEHLKGRSTRSMQKKEKKNKKRARKQSSNGKKQPNPVGGPSTRDRKKRHRRSKLITPETTEMPPWLAQYENDNLLDPFIQEEEGNKIHYEHDTEPQYQNTQHNEISRDLSAIYQESSISNKHNTNNMKEFQNAKAQMQRLQLAMSGIFYRPQSTAATSHPDAISYFTPSEIHEVLDSIRVASNSNPNLMSGCADFLYLMLTLEEEGVLSSDFLSDPWTNDDTDDDINAKEETKGVGTNLGHEPHSIMTRDVLVAAAFHYCDCVRARKAGVYNYVRRAMEASLDLRKLEQRHELWLPPAVSDGEDEIEVDQGLGAHPTTQTVNPQIDDSAMLARHTTSVRSGKVAVEEYGEESAKIAAGAARLKRAEIMATTLNANESTKLKDSSKPSTVVSSSASPSQTLKRNSKASNDDSAILRSFLVSLSEDWRSLVIRSAACLYRLRGIADADEDANQGRNSSRPTMLSTTSMRTARDALRIYAPLAQRLGMQRLKSELENTAFRILYRRQYSVASSLYSGDIEEMKTIVQVLSSRIEQLLRSDPVIMDQIEDVSVSSRVKEAYSLWKKMLRYRRNAASAKNNVDESTGTDESASTPMTLSIKWVPDAIALRVVLRARRLSPYEDKESIRTREKMLCYFALKLISEIWPASSANPAKDYIKNPKPNGYQSLHYTASLLIHGEDWPFEVQVRSEEMHRIAEYGVAAHWDYKLQNKIATALPQEPLSDSNDKYTSTLALPAAPVKTESRDTDESAITELNVSEEPHDSSNESKGRIASYIEALTTSRENIVQNNVFVFLSSTKSALDGRIVSVDPGACTVGDVLDKYGVVINESENVRVYQNGVETTMNGELSNGDVLTLPGSCLLFVDEMFAS